MGLPDAEQGIESFAQIVERAAECASRDGHAGRVAGRASRAM
jgi:hypothetical protein